MTEAKEKVEQAVANVRPLNATQSRNLEKLVLNDFHTLELEIREMHDETLRAKIDELGKDTSEENQKKLAAKAQKLIDKYSADRTKLIAEAKAMNITLTMPQIDSYRHSIDTSDDVLQLRINEVTKQANRELKSVLLVLERKKSEALRKVMIASITAQAEEILAAIPSAREFMIEAAAEKAAKAIES